MEFLIAKAAETAPAQTIRIESAPIKLPLMQNEKWIGLSLGTLFWVFLILL